ncbi:MAG: hypothetical protein NTX17_09930 [Candidatus Eisenbacteria bacterium]|nr:hypothetical protein [Candidatus Eisenbacteria bacterium]
MNKSIGFLLAVTLVAFPAITLAEDSSASLGGEISWSVIRTEIEKDALGFVAKVSPKLSESRYFATNSIAGYLGPTVEVRTGGNDSFESVLAKLRGFILMPRPLDQDGEPDNLGWVHVLPFSVGIESDRDFNNPVALAEFGWTPLGPREPINQAELAHSTRFGLDPDRAFGLFIQGGYKFSDQENISITSNTSSTEGGNTDQSDEKPDQAIARVKAELVYGFDLAESIRLLPTMTGWYDIKNSKEYYRLECLIRVAITKDKYSLDFRYENGSGAPNFSKGDQFSTGLALAF